MGGDPPTAHGGGDAGTNVRTLPYGLPMRMARPPPGVGLAGVCRLGTTRCRCVSGPISQCASTWGSIVGDGGSEGGGAGWSVARGEARRRVQMF